MHQRALKAEKNGCNENHTFAEQIRNLRKGGVMGGSKEQGWCK